MKFMNIEKSVRNTDWSMQDLHSHPHYEIYFLAKGNRAFFLQNAMYKLSAPIILIIPPHVMHKTEGGAFERYNINVAPDYLDPFQKHVLKSKALTVITPNEKETEQLVNLLNEALDGELPSKYSECINQALFSYTILALDKINNSLIQPALSAENTIPPLVLKVIDYMNENYGERITLDALAKSFFVSKATLIYNFKRHTNCSPIDFLLNVRLTKAKEMLLNTKKSVNEISEACGFSSANYFGLIFKKKEKLSPAAYRKYQLSKT